MLSGCPELEAQKSTLSQFWKLKKDTLCQSWKLKKAPCPAAHPQYPQVWKFTPPPPGSSPTIFKFLDAHRGILAYLLEHYSEGKYVVSQGIHGIGLGTNVSDIGMRQGRAKTAKTAKSPNININYYIYSVRCSIRYYRNVVLWKPPNNDMIWHY